MTTFDLTLVPNSVQIGLRGNTGLFNSGVNGSSQTVDRGGLRWEATLTYNNLRNDNRAELMGLLAGLRAQANRLRIPVHDNPARGSYGGTPLVAGASQTGGSLTIDGCTPSITNWARTGDYVGITVNGEVELKMLTADVDSDGSGNATLTFSPNLRAAPDDNAVVIVDDGTLGAPTGVFVLQNPVNGWSTEPGQFSSFSLVLVEDYFASQT